MDSVFLFPYNLISIIHANDQETVFFYKIRVIHVGLDLLSENSHANI